MTSLSELFAAISCYHALKSSVELNKSVLRYLSLVFFGQDILMSGNFLGLKFQARVFFGFAI